MRFTSPSFLLLMAGCGVADLTANRRGQPLRANETGYQVLANNDLGMHCIDKTFSVFSILPPYNVVNAQVVKSDPSGKATRLDGTTVRLTYVPVADRAGSINSKSSAKTDFWKYAAQLFGVSLAPGQGLKGLYMPADAPASDPPGFTWSPALGMFRAEGIPVTPTDDKGRTNFYPLVRVSAYDVATNRLLGSVDTVLPVSDETSCSNCHATGKAAASDAGVRWADDADLEVQARKNIILLHDLDEGTRLASSLPVLCARCHYSVALDLSGAGPTAEQRDRRSMSAVMHAFHSKAIQQPGLVDAPVGPGKTPPPPSQQACYQCHPGARTQCLRGAMTDTVDCQNCHGGMAAVGGASPLLDGGSLDGAADRAPRRPWVDVPRCQSCHTGDAKSHLTALAPMDSSGLRFLTAYRTGDPSASPIRSANQRFAEEPSRQFRASKGHGGIACEGCHGSTHALWSNREPETNDSVAPTELQGHGGFLGECSACHGDGLASSLDGPHGMHPVNSSKWMKKHYRYSTSQGASCKPCHGLDLKGTALSRAFADRTFTVEDGVKVVVKKGERIGCYGCHEGP